MKMQNSEPDHPDDRPPGRGHVANYSAADPAAEARQHAATHTQESLRWARKSETCGLKEKMHADFARVYSNLADAIERHRRNWAA